MATKVWASVPDYLAKKLDLKAELDGRSRSDLISSLLEDCFGDWEPPEADESDTAEALSVLRKLGTGQKISMGELAIAAKACGVETQSLVEIANQLGLKKKNGIKT